MPFAPSNPFFDCSFSSTSSQVSANMVCPGVLIVATQQIAEIDPSYYGFEGCSCHEGFHPNLAYNAGGAVISLQCIALQVILSHCTHA